MSGRDHREAPESLSLERQHQDLLIEDLHNPAESQGSNSQEGTPKKPVKIEIDSSTYIKTKYGPEKMSNFIFSVDSHSLINDKDGNKIYILRCSTKTAKFKVPLILSDTDSYMKITAKIREEPKSIMNDY